MLEKRNNNGRGMLENYISFLSESYLYISSNTKRKMESLGYLTRACDVYIDSEKSIIRIVPNNDGEYSLSPNNKKGSSGLRICAYNIRNCGLKRGIRYPVTYGTDYIEFCYGEDE